MSKREIVLPSSVLGEGDYKSTLTTYKLGNKIISSVIGLYDRSEGKEIKVIALRGKYYPKIGDRVVGIITKDSIFSWSVNINSYVEAILPFSLAVKKKSKEFMVNLSKLLTVNDVIYAEIVSYNKFSPPILSLKGKGLGKITSGYMLSITSGKVPRLIGKKHSMIKMLKEMLGINIIVGKNGLIVALTEDFEKVKILEEVVNKIELEAHVPGLTDRIKNLLESKLSKNN